MKLWRSKVAEEAKRVWEDLTREEVHFDQQTLVALSGPS